MSAGDSKISWWGWTVIWEGTVSHPSMTYLNGGGPMLEVLSHSQALVASHMKKNLLAMLSPLAIHRGLLALGVKTMALPGHLLTALVPVLALALVQMGPQVDGIVLEIEIVNAAVPHMIGMVMSLVRP